MATEVSNAGAFRVFLGTVGFALGFFGVEYLVEPAGGHRQLGGSLLALAFVTEAAAFKWPVIALRAKSRATFLVVVSVSVLVGVVAQRVSGGPWLVAVVAGLAVIGTYVVSLSIAFVIRLRIDLDRYAMPRIVNPEQADAISKHVHGAGSITVKVNPCDREALEYAGGSC
jgi:cyanate permease